MVKVVSLALIALAASTAWAQNPPQPGFFVDNQVLWFDSRLTDDFELAPRLVFGYDDAIGARVRYWSYDEGTFEIFGGGTLQERNRLDFDVIDLEATTHLRREGHDFLFAGGARIAHIDRNNNTIGVLSNTTTFEKTTMGGVTLAAEGRTSIFAAESWGTAFVYGGRLSLLHGDWEGDNSDTMTPDTGLNVQNERFIVPEVFTGVELHYGNVFTRMRVEMQDWQGGATETFTTVNHNFGFTGYGVDLGVTF
jgi:hypothetical protein